MGLAGGRSPARIVQPAFTLPYIDRLRAQGVGLLARSRVLPATDGASIHTLATAMRVWPRHDRANSCARTVSTSAGLTEGHGQPVRRSRRSGLPRPQRGGSGTRSILAAPTRR